MLNRSFVFRTAMLLLSDFAGLAIVELIRFHAGVRTLSYAELKFMLPIACIIFPSSIVGGELGRWLVKKQGWLTSAAVVRVS